MACVPRTVDTLEWHCSRKKDASQCAAVTGCAWGALGCAPTANARCDAPLGLCAARTETQCAGEAMCKWGPAATCPAPHVKLRNGCGVLPSTDSALAHGDTVRLLPRAVQVVRTGRVLPLAGSLIGCCPTLADGDGVCAAASTCTYDATAPAPGGTAPAGCGARDVCARITQPPGPAGSLVDLMNASPPLPVQCINLGEVPGSTVCFRRRKADLYEAARYHGSQLPNDVNRYAALHEGWYYGELLAARDDATLVLLRSTGELTTVPVEALYVLDSGWPTGTGGGVTVGTRPLRMGERVVINERELGVVIAFDNRASVDMRATCPQRVETITAVSDTEELHTIPLGDVRFAHGPEHDVLAHGSTASVHFDADAGQRYARAGGGEADRVDVEYLARNANHTSTWSEVWETRLPDGPLNDVNGRVLHPLDMHTHLCVLDDSGPGGTSYFPTPAARQAKLTEVRKALPGHEVDWPSRSCMRARRAAAPVGDAVQRACCWEGAAKDAACAAGHAATGHCPYPCSVAGDGAEATCGYALGSVYEQPCGVSDSTCRALMQTACTGVNRRSRACEHFADFAQRGAGAAPLAAALDAHCGGSVELPLAYSGLAASSASCSATGSGTPHPPPLAICGKRAQLQGADHPPPPTPGPGRPAWPDPAAAARAPRALPVGRVAMAVAVAVAVALLLAMAQARCAGRAPRRALRA
jgi:hypothetical protein